MAIGKVGSNGTLNENGTFYSVQDVNTLLENLGGSDLPEPTVEDAGKSVVVGEDGKYTLGDGGGSGGGLVVTTTISGINASYKQISEAVNEGRNIIFIDNTSAQGQNLIYHLSAFGSQTSEGTTTYVVLIYGVTTQQTMIKTLVSTNENDNMTVQV